MAGYQIIGLTTYYDERAREHRNKDHYRGQQVEDYRELFHDAGLLSRLGYDESDRVNLFYTLNLSTDAKREFARAELLAFDIDGGPDLNKADEYQAIVAEVLGVPQDAIQVVCSGNGFHFILALENPGADKTWFYNHRPQYQELGRRMDAKLAARGLPGTVDRGVFEHRRILRLPFTTNRKKDKPDRPAYSINKGSFAPQPIDFAKLTGLPDLTYRDEIKLSDLKNFTPHSGAAALTECRFLNFVKENPNDVEEPQWYAASSIVPRFQGGRELFHKMSEGHASYSADATEAKMNHAMKAGPRTCASISGLWDGCGDCPHFGHITSPIVIKDPLVIPTEATGFHNVDRVDSRGRPLPPKPNYRDLLRALERDTHYFLEIQSNGIFVFDTTHWRLYLPSEVKAFAEVRCAPHEIARNVRDEFLAKVQVNNMRQEHDVRAFFHDETAGVLNLADGVLNLDTHEVTPHSPDHGFTYVLPFSYDPHAKCPRFMQFLNEVTVGRADLAATLLDFMAYCFVPGMADNMFLWLSGGGRNGKSTFLYVLQQLLGQKNSSSVPLNMFDRPDYLAHMENKLVNIATEGDTRKVLPAIASPLKALSGDDVITVRRLYGVPFETKSRTKLVFASNVRPNFVNVDQAVARRLVLVPFELQLADFREEGEGAETKEDTKQEADLKPQLLAEMPGILNLVLTRLAHQRGKTFEVHRNKISAEEAKRIARESDPMEEWLHDVVIFESGAKTEIAVLHESYSSFVEANEERYKISKRALASELIQRFPQKLVRTKIGKRCEKGVMGLRLKSDQDYPEEKPTAEF